MSTSASRRWPNPPLVAPPSSSGWATRSPSSRRISTRRPRCCELIREFDARAGWNSGFRSCAEWLSWRVGRHPRGARQALRRAGSARTRPPEVGAVVIQALTAAREALYHKAHAQNVPAGTSGADVSTEPPTMPQQQADALALVAETALHHGIDPGAPGERYQVVVHVDAPVLADADAPGQSVLDDGAHVSAETSQRLACDASRVVMGHDPDGRIFEVGARTRTIPPALRRALHHRDRGCRFPGCGLRF